jgi:hypothetical protein
MKEKKIDSEKDDVGALKSNLRIFFILIGDQI